MTSFVTATYERANDGLWARIQNDKGQTTVLHGPFMNRNDAESWAILEMNGLNTR